MDTGDEEVQRKGAINFEGKLQLDTGGVRGKERERERFTQFIIIIIIGLNPSLYPKHLFFSS